MFDMEQIKALFKQLQCCAVGTAIDCGCKTAVGTAIYYELNDAFIKWLDEVIEVEDCCHD